MRRLPDLALAALAAAMLLACGCGARSERSASNTPAATGAHIGMMVGTVSQSEEEFRAAEQLARRFPGRVKIVTYPDNFMQEQETVIAQMTGLASDPQVKVIIASQGIPGSVAAARKIREERPDILIGFIKPQEDPKLVGEVADITINADELSRGRTMLEEAIAMGAKTYVHYSFPRHMSMELLAGRRAIMEREAKTLGIKFVYVAALDPMGEGGLPAAQQFIIEDVPREVRRYGKNTAFFSTNCGMQEPLIRGVMETGAYLPEQCCPSPTHGYPGALGIRIPPEHAGDMAYINAENKRIVTEHGMNGHFGTWAASENMVATRAMARLLMDAVDKHVDYKDQATVQRYLAEEAGVDVKLKRFESAGGNQYLMLLAHEIY